MAFGHDKLAVLRELLRLDEPLGGDAISEEATIRKLIAEPVMHAPVEGGEFLGLLHSVYVDVLVYEANVISGYADHTFDEVLLRIHRVAEDDNVLALNRLIGKRAN